MSALSIERFDAIDLHAEAAALRWLRIELEGVARVGDLACEKPAELAAKSRRLLPFAEHSPAQAQLETVNVTR